MKKQIKLKLMGKVLLTLILIGVGILIYSKLGDIGSEALKDRLAGVLCIVGWIYLIFGQIMLLANIWED